MQQTTPVRSNIVSLLMVVTFKHVIATDCNCLVGLMYCSQICSLFIVTYLEGEPRDPVFGKSRLVHSGEGFQCSTCATHMQHCLMYEEN
jgi:hypothetical protein